MKAINLPYFIEFMATIKIFLASSQELVEDRQEFESFISRENKYLHDKGLFLELVIWEDFLDSVSETRKQDDYNRAIEECEIFVLLYFTKVGKYTEEEFDTAYNHFKKSGRPKIFTYFKDADLGLKSGKIDPQKLNMLQSLVQFQEKLKDIEHFHSVYSSKGDLKANFSDQLKKLEQQGFFDKSSPLIPVAEDVLLSSPPSDEWIRDYLNNACEELHYVKVPIPLGDKSDRLELEHVYVPLQLRLQHYSQETGEHAWPDLLTKERIAIIGDAGSGKSTLMRYIALKVARHHLHIQEDHSKENGITSNTDSRLPESRMKGCPLMIPVFVDLAKSNDLWNREKGNVEEISPERWLSFFKKRLYTLSEKEIEGLFKTGKVLFLFDGLDEVPEPEDRLMLITGFAKLQRAFNPLHGRNRVFIACRSAAWDTDNEYMRFEKVEVQPMDKEICKRYLWNWCKNVWGDQSENAYSHLLKSISSSHAAADIATNPQMATMLSLVQNDYSGQEQVVFPVQRALLYKLFVNQFIKLESRATTCTRDELKGHLIALAMEMQIRKNKMGESLNSIMVKHACQLLGKRLESTGKQTLGKKDLYNKGLELLHTLEIHTGLLEIDQQSQLYLGSNFVRFKHRTLQEFLAACHYAEVGIKGLLDHATEPGWAETIALTCGLLAQYDEFSIKEFLEELLHYDKFPEESQPDENDLVKLAPRVAAATICFYELASYHLSEETLKPVRNAHNLMLPLLNNPESDLNIETRINIAEGLGTQHDPRLTQEERWVVIPSGTFVKGSEDPEAWAQERPCCNVELEEYMIQRWPVTVREYARFINDGGYSDKRWWPESQGGLWRDENNITGPENWEKYLNHGNRPVTGISWWEAWAYCRWYAESDLSLKHDWDITLPTEEQWEGAAGAISREQTPQDDKVQKHRYPWGVKWQDNCANYAGVGFNSPSPVGVFPAGYSVPFKLWDMAGNVNEWCADTFAPYGVHENHSIQVYKKKSVRGGSFQANPLDLRVTNRFGLSPDQRSLQTGFRCVAVRKNKTQD